MKFSRIVFILAFLQAVISPLIAQPGLSRTEPPYWWADMKSDALQLLVYGNQIAACTPEITYPGVSLDSVIRTQNPNYLFLNITIDPHTLPGVFPLRFHYQSGKGNNTLSVQYELKQRETGSSEREGFGQNDIIYMLMPDRFANGDTTNDNMPGMLEKSNRSNPDGRHGGDIQGIIDHAYYFSDILDVTALWINPLTENNMPAYSYHGYAATDFYRIDPRFGTLELYRQLSDTLKYKDVKLISDMVFNHCGLNHWWMKDLPTSTWIHTFPQFTRSNYRAETLMDPYAAESDRREMLNGWFDQGMPDLNQQDPLLAMYLIQNSIWWIETAGLQGIRMDTWPYVDASFLAEWIRRVMLEYPNFSILGETWLQKEAHTAWFQENPGNQLNPSSRLSFLTDFPLSYAINRAFGENDSWTGGVANLYYVLNQDFIYADPKNLITFLDNHDVARYFTNQQENLNQWEMGMTFLFTTRGIPVIYYGTEILMQGDKSKGDADLRKDFPGGWPGDPVNVFTGKGLSADEVHALNKFYLLVKLRKSELFQQGKLTHYVPREGVYVYGWQYRDRKMVVIINNAPESRLFDTKRFIELTGENAVGTDPFSGETYPLSEPFTIPSKKALILIIK